VLKPDGFAEVKVPDVGTLEHLVRHKMASMLGPTQIVAFLTRCARMVHQYGALAALRPSICIALGRSFTQRAHS